VKARIIKPSYRRNPDHNPRLPAGPDNPCLLDVPVGEEIDHPDAWRLCLPIADGPRAEPIDDEARAAVERWHKERQLRLEQLRADQARIQKQAAKGRRRRRAAS